MCVVFLKLLFKETSHRNYPLLLNTSALHLKCTLGKLHFSAITILHYCVNQPEASPVWQVFTEI